MNSFTRPKLAEIAAAKQRSARQELVGREMRGVLQKQKADVRFSARSSPFSAVLMLAKEPVMTPVGRL